MGRCFYLAFTCSWQSRTDSVHLKDRWEDSADPGELSVPLESPMKLSGPGDICRPQGTQLTSQSTKSPYATGSRQKLWFLLQNRDGSSQLHLNAIREVHPGRLGTEMCAQNITSFPAHSQALEPSMRRDLAKDMQWGPRKSHPAIPPLPAPLASCQPCAYLSPPPWPLPLTPVVPLYLRGQ